jgi:hypothetical protein
MLFLAIDKSSIRRIIPPNILKDVDEDEYASYGGQRTGWFLVKVLSAR